MISKQNVIQISVLQTEAEQWGDPPCHPDHGWTGRLTYRHAGAGANTYVYKETHDTILKHS